MGAYETFLRPLLFRFDAESVHHAALAACSLLPPLPRGVFAFEHPRLELEIAGLRFPGPVGLGAGFDKDGTAVRTLGAIGFGSVEVGSVSAAPSAGNAGRPRLFRLPHDEALLVYYGVPSEGADKVARRLSGVRLPVPLGVSIVETNTGQPNSLEGVVRELTRAMRTLAPAADYIALNLQCPNSDSGPLNDPAGVAALLSALGGERPLLLKVAASTDPRRIDAFLQAIDPFPAVRGVILSSLLPKPYTTLRTPPETLRGLPGSVTGAPLKALARDLVRSWYARIDRKRHVLVGVGGVQTAEDAYALIRGGATLVQLVTALVYQGPRLPGRIHRDLARLLERDGVARVTDAVGVDSR